MDKLLKIAISISIVVSINIIIGCKEQPDSIDTDVYIINSYKSNERGGSANVKYQIENIGSKNIRGWNIYFRVSMESGMQVQAFDGLTYYLKSGETSEPLIATGVIPVHYKEEDRPSNASLQLIEVY